MKLEPLLYVSDFQKSIRFYSKVLGFELGELYPNKENPSYVPIFIGTSKLMLAQARKTNKKFYSKGLGGSGAQFFVQVNNVDKKWRQVKDKVEIIDEIETRDWGDREFTIKDPDGYLISFFTPTK
ncbi:hypothetical protein A2Z22_00895 [Candidatus Woesebacteria bacterium RBG_16_34_12]|uniref:VOC domain-containing protein n=1 Tax=Candidatus Woesebacteria bacterium RBG_16_34_12 TaxID=1802480 RepID=A0A1F7X8R5_9BACT|nr:MAG: hypothetical protein A2Z22_00895 [Candidatus Woesebacteria bacterium RBG_16_34_12]